MRPTPDAPKKGAFSVLGLALILIFLLTVGAILFPLFASARAAASSANFGLHLKDSSQAVYLYTLDNDHRIPLAQDWIDRAEKYAESKDCFHIPRAFGQPVRDDFYGIALNSAVSGKSTESLEKDTVMLFYSTKAERNASDNLTSLRWPIYGGMATDVAFINNTRSRRSKKDEPTKSKLNGPLSVP